jgi:hypothetical protein
VVACGAGSEVVEGGFGVVVGIGSATGIADVGSGVVVKMGTVVGVVDAGFGDVVGTGTVVGIVDVVSGDVVGMGAVVAKGVNDIDCPALGRGDVICVSVSVAGLGIDGGTDLERSAVAVEEVEDAGSAVF